MAEELDKAVEIDGYPDRQDLNVDLLKLAKKKPDVAFPSAPIRMAPLNCGSWNTQPRRLSWRTFRRTASLNSIHRVNFSTGSPVYASNIARRNISPWAGAVSLLLRCWNRVKRFQQRECHDIHLASRIVKDPRLPFDAMECDRGLITSRIAR